LLLYSSKNTFQKYLGMKTIVNGNWLALWIIVRVFWTLSLRYCSNTPLFGVFSIKSILLHIVSVRITHERGHNKVFSSHFSISFNRSLTGFICCIFVYIVIIHLYI
jgi:hypothetical protein